MRDWLGPLREWFYLRPASTGAARLSTVVAAASAWGSDFSAKSDAELVAAGRSASLESDDGLATYLAVARELAARSVGLRPFDVQLQAAAAMLRGISMELATGEGKTLVGAIVAAGHALSGNGVHVLSANDYLAQRDAAWMAPFFASLHLTVGAVTADTVRDQRRQAYAADVVYVSVTESGFDILRDRLVLDPAGRVRSVTGVAILDEADAVLLDEARVPLVLAAESGTAPEAVNPTLGNAVALMVEGTHFDVDQDRRTLNLTDEGLTLLEEHHPQADLFGPDHELLAQTYVALHAEALLTRDVDYIIRDGRAWLISQARGRIEQLQRWPEGLQAAIEAKEGLTPSPGLDVLDQIMMADLVSDYEQVVGMSATLVTAAEELHQLYDIEVAKLPPNTPCIRVDEASRLFETATQRDAAALELLTRAHTAGQPVLVATQSVTVSEKFASNLTDAGLTCQVLNARNDSLEAAIVGQAGQVGRITVSTQMAGRGTDIHLSPESRALGGLFIIGLGIFPSQRLELQIRGRSGRQGDPGRSVFLHSLDDDLIAQTFPNHRLPAKITAAGEVLDPRLHQLATHVQRVSDAEHASLRDLTHRYGKLLGLQRRKLLILREDWLTNDDAVAAILDTVPETIARTREAGVPDADLIRASRAALLTSLDDAWTQHLDYASSVKEGIHLRVLVKEQPVEEFNRILAAAPPIISATTTAALQLINRAPIEDGQLDLEGAGMREPSATWAYTVTDNSLGTELERLSKGLSGGFRLLSYY